MSARPSYVLDTNVLVSAVLFEDSVPGRAFAHALDHGEILLSEPLVDELQEVLTRKKFDRHVTLAIREQFLVKLIDAARLVEFTEEIDDCRDPNDNMLLALAVSGSATAVITGDSDLLALNPFRGSDLLTPASFLAQQGS